MASSDKTVVLITGASSGIGLETVLALSQSSPNYSIILGSRTLEKGNQVLADLRATHGDSLKSAITVVQIEITDAASIRAAKEQVESTFGRLDVLLNNAGKIFADETDTVRSLRLHLETNAVGPAIVTETFVPLLQKSSRPTIIYVSSDQGSISVRLDRSAPWYRLRGDHYRMSKAALNMLAACHRVGFEEWGCRVCAFNPGFCVTNLSGEQRREFRRANGARDPREPARALVGIVEGKRDGDFEASGMLDVDGGILPW